MYNKIPKTYDAPKCKKFSSHNIFYLFSDLFCNSFLSVVSAWPGRKSLDPVTVVSWLSDGKDVCSLVITPALYTVFKTLLGAADGIF